MEIRSIKSSVTNVDKLEYKPNTKENSPKSNIPQTKDILVLTDWQKSIVEIALKYLENKNQVDNNHPLSQGRFKQIQTLEEALKELEETRKEKFKEEGLSAQANINPENVLSLFLQ